MRALSLVGFFLVSFVLLWVVGAGLMFVTGVQGENSQLVPFVLESLGQGFAPLKALLAGPSGDAQLDSPSENMAFKALLACTGLAFAQAAFVAPLVGPLRLAPTGRSLRSTVIGAALVAGLLTALVGWSLFEVFALLGPTPDSSGGGSRSELEIVWIRFIIPSWIVCGAAWTAVLWKAGGSRDPDGIARFARRMLAGTGLELLLAVPLLVMIRRRAECYCATASFWALVIGFCSLIWLCGPGLVLLLTAESRRAWRAAACPGCGGRAPSAGGSCPSCGRAVPARTAT